MHLPSVITENSHVILAGLGGVFFGLLKGIIVDAIKDRFSRPSKLFPDMRGTWCVYAEPSKSYKEQLVIHWQYTKRFKGTLTSKANLPGIASIQQIVIGEFVDSTTALCTIVIKDDETVREYGAGLFRLNNDLRSGIGISVVYGISSKEPIVWKYSFERNIDPKGNRLRECSDDLCKECVAYTGTATSTDP